MAFYLNYRAFYHNIEVDTMVKLNISTGKPYTLQYVNLDQVTFKLGQNTLIYGQSIFFYSWVDSLEIPDFP